MKPFTLHTNSHYFNTIYLSAMLATTLFMDSCCGPAWDFLVSCYNFTDKKVMVYVARGIRFDSLTEYPDTLLPTNMDFDSKMPNNCNDPELYSESIYLTVWPPHEKGICIMDRGTIPDTISVFIINPDTLKTYGYDYIAEHYKIICRYDLSREDIRALNYIIPFPPNRTMEHMHMFPSYQDIINKTSNYEE